MRLAEDALVLELRRALAGLIRAAETEGMSPIAAELCDAKAALGMSPEQAIADFREQVEFFRTVKP